jgi:hypothetical protein
MNIRAPVLIILIRSRYDVIVIVNILHLNANFFNLFVRVIINNTLHNINILSVRSCFCMIGYRFGLFLPFLY